MLSEDEMQELIKNEADRMENPDSRIDQSIPPMQICPRTGIHDYANDAVFGCWHIGRHRRGRLFSIHLFLSKLKHGVNWHHSICDGCKLHICDICRRKHKRCL